MQGCTGRVGTMTVGPDSQRERRHCGLAQPRPSKSPDSGCFHFPTTAPQNGALQGSAPALPEAGRPDLWAGPTAASSSKCWLDFYLLHERLRASHGPPQRAFPWPHPLQWSPPCPYTPQRPQPVSAGSVLSLQLEAQSSETLTHREGRQKQQAGGRAQSPLSARNPHGQRPRPHPGAQGAPQRTGPGAASTERERQPPLKTQYQHNTEEHKTTP